MQDTLPIQVYKDIFPLKGSRKKVNNDYLWEEGG